MRQLAAACLLSCLLVILLHGKPVHASVTGDPVDLSASFSFPSFDLDPCLLLSASQVPVGDGVELTSDDEVVANCSGGAEIDVDGSNNTVTLIGFTPSPFSDANYETALFEISDVDWLGAPAEIDSVMLASSDLFVDDDPSYVVPEPVVSFGPDLITIQYDPAGTDEFAFKDGGTAVFEFTVAVIPEPSTALLLSAGLVGLGLQRRRQ